MPTRSAGISCASLLLLAGLSVPPSGRRRRRLPARLAVARRAVMRSPRRDHGAIMGSMPLDQASRALQDTAALWSIGAVTPQAVVMCACDALVAGLDSRSLRILAGLTRAEADYHVLDQLPAALAELGLDFFPPDSPSGQEAAARALAALAVSGLLTPRELAAAIHQHFGHGPAAGRAPGCPGRRVRPRRICHHDARSHRPGSHR